MGDLLGGIATDIIILGCTAAIVVARSLSHLVTLPTQTCVDIMIVHIAKVIVCLNNSCCKKFKIDGFINRKAFITVLCSLAILS